ncbi:N6-adenosine-methyltransferase 70 kDa subunit [Zancudomyces culisetae]|uniref:mRNA m(6)A methyltransferase n=1 Tax=Zancudomyces culisetae TaxID=1213189 RepID=A0A1R1PNN2_ZANCU|nr:N6-adenosine-methyltransferase 70 kDa subunit [Zancudomyces culisetae]|eukprot:OMH82560.1 N6-adenosine-methyltransferase 70 kDa subunit [Zancudomyces culisetae]
MVNSHDIDNKLDIKGSNCVDHDLRTNESSKNSLNSNSDSGNFDGDYKNTTDPQHGRIQTSLGDFIKGSKVSPESSPKREVPEKTESTQDTQQDTEEFQAPEYCVPIKANVMDFDWSKLAAACQFDVIVMDPPWQLASQAPTRGVAIAYQQLPDVCIESLPIGGLQQEGGFLFIWVINNKFSKAFELFRAWGYTYVDEIAWVKQTVNRRMAKGHGYYLQHAKESCLIGVKNKASTPQDPPASSISCPLPTQLLLPHDSSAQDTNGTTVPNPHHDILEPKGTHYNIGSDVIFSERRGQSQKPEELYELIEELVPGGRYLEIFGRKNNLRDYWVTVGNEL